MNKKLIHSLFENKVLQYNSNVAIETSSGNFTYDQINIISNKISFLLQEHTNTGDCVAVYFKKELFYIFSVLGIFKSNTVYVPIDKKYNKNHWKEVFETIKPKVFLISREYVSDLKYYSDFFGYDIPMVILFYLDEGSIGFSIYKDEQEEKIDLDSLSSDKTNISINEEDSNYIFFTSGSTGAPKMVLGQHKSLSHFIHWQSNEFEITEKDRLGQLTSFSFDASLRDIFVPLINGATICIPPENIRSNIIKLCQWFRDQKITLIHTVPTFFRLILSEDNIKNSFYLRHIFLAGEKLYNKDIINWQNKYGCDTAITNFYGATESTLIKSFYTVNKKLVGNSSNLLPVGKPISNTAILIFNEDNKLCRIDEKGEIFIKTPFLSKGYYKNPLETSKKFIQNPLSTNKEIIYKTGDYGKYDKDRNSIVLGRIDSVVKVNGVRVDLNAIEKVILSKEEVIDVKCILSVRDENSILACFYKAKANLDKEIQSHCSEYLSNYELPSLYFYLPDFPINANGKVDIQVLKTKVNEFGSQGTLGVELNETQEKLAGIWKSILKIENINAVDNFFLRGGQSINAMQLITAYQKEFDVVVNLDDIFENPTLESHENLISNAKKENFKPIKRNHDIEKIPLSFAQKSMWIACQLSGSEVYNMPSHIQLSIDDDYDVFEKALCKAIERHEILRTVFQNDGDEVYQFVIPFDDFDFKLGYIDFSNESNAEDKAREYIENDSYKPFDLEKGPLIRAKILKVNHEHTLFYYNMHHLICDAESIEFLYSEIVRFYESLKNNTEEVIPELKIQYRDFAIWQNELAKSYDAQEQYWLSIYDDQIPEFNLSIAKKLSSSDRYQGKMIKSHINKDLFRKITEFNEKNISTFYIHFYTVLGILLFKYSHNKDIIIGSPFSSRSHWDLKNQIGLHLNTLAIRSKIIRKQSFVSYVKQVRKSVFEAQENKDYPFDLLLQKINNRKGITDNPLFNVFLVVNKLNIDGSDETSLEDLVMDTRAKFDISFRFTLFKNKADYSLIFNNSIFEESDMIKFNQEFLTLLEFTINNPFATISQCENFLKTEIAQEEHRSFKEQFISNYSEDF